MKKIITIFFISFKQIPQAIDYISEDFSMNKESNIYDEVNFCIIKLWERIGVLLPTYRLTNSYLSVNDVEHVEDDHTVHGRVSRKPMWCTIKV